GLGDAGDFTLHRHFTQFVASQPKFAEDAARTTRDDAAIALARRVGIARQLLQLQPSLVTFFVGLRLIGDDRFQFGTASGELVSQLGALDIAIDECEIIYVIS